MKARWRVLSSLGALALVATLVSAPDAFAQPGRGGPGGGGGGGGPGGGGGGGNGGGGGDGGGNDVSPVRQIERNAPLPAPPAFGPGLRTIDGAGNNPLREEVGAAGIALLRLTEPAYGDGVSTLAGADRPSARAISNAICAQGESQPNPRRISDFLWQWGQFVDHDIDLTDGADPPEPAPIAVPAGDPFFDPTGSGEVTIDLNRSLYDPETAEGEPRQQLNEITAWVDASNVYGSDIERAEALRANDGTGRLRTSARNLLPFNEEGLPNAGGSGDTLFLAGDVRANEQLGLLAMHTLFVREHNRLADQIRDASPNLSGDQVYERARRIVGAQMQVITYEEFLPALLGSNAIPPYEGYDPEIDASIANVFSTGAYRFGHSALSPQLLRLNANGNEIAAGHVALRDAFFAPQRIIDEGGIGPLLRGLASQVCQSIDPFVIDDVRNFLFGPPGSSGFDLASLNIQRGRDHGLPSYNDARREFGLRPAITFGDVTDDPEIAGRLASVYSDVEEIDLWVGGLAETPVAGGMVGELFHAVLSEQFQALRDGDRLWYARTLGANLRAEVEGTRLSDIIRRNTNIGDEIPDDVFRVPAP